MADEEKPKFDGEQINLKVKDQDGGEVQFKVKKSTKFSKIFEAYCNKKSLTKDQMRFLQDGTRIQDNQTPEELDMEDGDCIEAMMLQVGGF